MKIENSYDDLNFPFYRSEIYSMSHLEKTSLEEIAKIAGADKNIIERIIREEKERRRSLSRAMFKGKYYPTDQELHKMRFVRKMSTTQMAEKLGTSENSVCRMLEDRDMYDGKKPKTPGYTPTKEEFQKMMKKLTIGQIARKYHKRYGWAVALRDGYDLGKKSPTWQEKSYEEPSTPENRRDGSITIENEEGRVLKLNFLNERPEKKKKPSNKKTVRDAYFRYEKDITLEREHGLD